MSYTHMTVSGRHRVVATGTEGARFLTSATDATAAASIAAALTEATEDLAHALVSDLVDLGGMGEPHDVIESVDSIADVWDGWDSVSWSQLPAPATPVDLTRRALAYLDNPDGRHQFSPYGYGASLSRLAKSLLGQPDSVVRAVRDELATWLAPYDQVPVFAVVHDYKWDEVRTLCCINAGLASATSEQLAEYVNPATAWKIQYLLDPMQAAGYGDFRYADSVAEQGYLAVVANRAQLAAWISRQQA